MTSSHRSGQKFKIVIVDDHPIVRAGLAAVIGQDPGFIVVGECGTAEEAAASIRKHQPHLAIVDLTLGTASAIPLFRRLQHDQPSLRVLALSMHDETIFAVKALQAGAHGYLMKGAAIDTLNNAIRTVLCGKLYVSDLMRNHLLQGLAGRPVPVVDERPDNLTSGELVVLQMMGAGASTREIAEKLGRSLKTIETHRNNIRRKLNLPSSAALIRFATQWAQRNS